MASGNMKASLTIEAATKGLENIRQMISELKSAGVETGAFEQAADALSVELDTANRRMQQTGTQAGALGDKSRNLAKEMSAVADKGARLSNELRQVAQAAGLNAQAAEKAEHAWSLFKGGLLAGAGFAAAQLGITGLTGAIGALRDGIAEVMRVGGKFEVLQKQLETLYGNAGKAEEAMAWIKDFSKATPFELDAVTESFVKLKAMGLDPMDGSFKAIAEQASALGGSGETLSGIVLALGQAWTKQKLQGEEALQLIERGVPVWDLLAKATGKTAVELQEMSSAGQLGRAAIRDLMDEMGRMNAGASTNALNTWNGQLSVLKSNWTEFLDLIARSGMLDLFREELRAVNEAIKEMAETGELKQWAQQASDAVVKLYGGLKTLGEWAVAAAGFVSTYSAELEALAKVAIGLKALGLGKTFLGWGADAMLGAKQAQAAAGILGKAGQVAAAGWLGWNVGTYLREEFLGIEQAGIALAAGLTKAAARAQAAWEMMKAPFTDGTVAEAQERLRQKLQEIDEQYTALFISAGKAREAQERSAAASDAASGAAQRHAQAQGKVATETDKAKVAQQELLNLLTSGAKGAQEAIDRLAAGLKFDTPQNLRAFVQELDALRTMGALSAKQVGEAWQQALEKLSVQQLDDFLFKVKAAFAQGKLSAQEFAQVNEQVLIASFSKLGVNAAQAMGKVSTGAQEAIRSIDLVADSAKAAGVGVQDAARALEMAFAAAIPKADSLQAIDAMEQKLKAMGAAGQVSADGMGRLQSALDKQRATIEGQIPGIQSLGEALRQLGVKPQAELKELARTAKEAFDVVQASGTATPREINEAWKAMAEAAIAANDGIADAAIKSQARQHGFVIETDKAGKSIVKSMKEAEDATKRVGDAARDGADGMRDLADAADDSRTALQKQADAQNEAANEAINAWMQAQQQADKYFLEMAKIARESGTWANEVPKLAWAMSAALKELDKTQQAIERSNQGAAQGLEDLKLRFLELNGSEEEMANARKAREEAEVRSKMELLRLDLERARIRKNNEEVERLTKELALFDEQLRVLDQIYKEEARQRNERERKAREERAQKEREAQARNDAPSAKSETKGGNRPIQITLNANGINDPAKLARLIEPELKRLAHFAR